MAVDQMLRSKRQLSLIMSGVFVPPNKDDLFAFGPSRHAANSAWVCNHYPVQDGLFILVDPNFLKALLSAQPCHYGHRIGSPCLAVFPMEIYDR